MALSKSSKILIDDINAIQTTANSALSTANAVNSALGGKQNNLGFTPIQQGGGHGQGTNKIYIGWSGSGLKCTVDQTDIGTFSFGSGGIAPGVSGVCHATIAYTGYVNYINNCTTTSWKEESVYTCYGFVPPAGGTWYYLTTSFSSGAVAGGSRIKLTRTGGGSENKSGSGIAIRVA